MKRYRVKPGKKVDLEKYDPNDTSWFSRSRKEAEDHLLKLNERLESLQELLYAEKKHGVLIILQAMDTGGKDGTIRKVFEGVNPQGVRVVSFKEPTSEELAHDFLWRVHKEVPRRGEMVIFNRSHYEDVLVVRVHKLASREVIQKRYEHINTFERILSDEGTTIIKFFLHISQDEQKKRLEARILQPEKLWKFNTEDLNERKLWNKYMRAYEIALNRTSTKWAPWYVVPADHKWYRNLIVGSVLIDTLEGLRMSYPKPEKGLEEIVIE